MERSLANGATEALITEHAQKERASRTSYSIRNTEARASANSRSSRARRWEDIPRSRLSCLRRIRWLRRSNPSLSSSKRRTLWIGRVLKTIIKLKEVFLKNRLVEKLTLEIHPMTTALEATVNAIRATARSLLRKVLGAGAPKLPSSLPSSASKKWKRSAGEWEKSWRNTSRLICR